MKKAISFILTVIMTLVLIPATDAYSGPEYIDVNENNWFYEPIMYAYDEGLMMGVEEFRFAPHSVMTRAMFTTVIFRMSGEGITGGGSFPDVNAGTWYSDAVAWASYAGIVGGYPDGTFRPDVPLTRAEAAKLIVGYIRYKDLIPTWDSSAPSSFADESRIPSWAAEYIEELRLTGIIAGDEQGRFNPDSGLTRAEAATVITRLHKMMVKLQVTDGIICTYPTRDGVGYVLGAQDLYYGGAGVSSSYAGLKLCTVNGMEMLCGDPDGRSVLVKKTVGEGNRKGLVPIPSPGNGNTITIWPELFNIPDGYTVMRVGYAPAGDLHITISGGADAYHTISPVTAGGINQVTFDLSDGSMTSFDETSTVSFAVDGDISLTYVAFFLSEDDAAGFDYAKEEPYIGERHSIHSEPNELDSETESEFNRIADSRRDSIVECSTDIDPETISGTCYYVSSLRGDDSNPGTSPDKPFETLSSLYETKAGGQIRKNIVKSGDAVFFERGSTFYPEFETNQSGNFCFDTASGATYGAYGDGPKPLFTSGVDLSDPDMWEETDYPGIYRCRELFPQKGDCLTYNDIGNIIFDDDMWGVRILTFDAALGDGVMAQDCGLVTNGRDVYSTSGIEMKNVGCMTGDLMYFQDWHTGELFLCSPDGNPGDRFQSIIASKKGSLVRGGSDAGTTLIDNIACYYSGSFAIDFTSNLIVQNCDTRYVGGSLQGDGVTDLTRFGNAIANYGDISCVEIRDCYVDQVFDAGLSVQTNSGQMRNITFTGCVIERANMSVEIFNGNGSDSPQSINLFVTDNIIRYAGYGLGCTTPQHERKGSFITGKQSGYANVSEVDFRNFVFENNLCLYSSYQSVMDTAIARGEHARGLILRNNIYVINGDWGYHLVAENNLIPPGAYSKAYYPCTEQYLTYLLEYGIDRGSQFYVYHGSRFVGDDEGVYRFPEIRQ